MLKRLYEDLIEDHLNQFNQMVFLSGPRQVGKTTISKNVGERSQNYMYLNWDDIEDRELILLGPKEIAKRLSLDVVLETKPILILDEIHKYGSWKTYLKGFFDKYKDQLKIIVTGSSKLDVYQAGGDSLMGRYFHYRIHPLSVREVCEQKQSSKKVVNPPLKIKLEDWDTLLKFGGFPDPFIKKNRTFYERWRLLRHKQFFQEDLRDLSKVIELSQMEILAKILESQAGQLTNYSSLSKKIRVSDKTVRNWIEILRSTYYCFLIRPWTKNVTRSLLKEPKIYLWDWSMVQDPGMRIENFVASHLFKAVHYWTDSGLGDFKLHFIRDLQKQEVDFLVSRNNQPWMLLEVKCSVREKLSKSLQHFSELLKPEHTFQVAFDLEFQDIDLFKLHTPKIVSMKTLLSQLL